MKGRMVLLLKSHSDGNRILFRRTAFAFEVILISEVLMLLNI